MSRLDQLKKAKGYSDFSNILGFSVKGLTYVVYIIPDHEKNIIHLKYQKKMEVKG